MRVLYGVVGEGMGHATRSRVVIDHLLSAGHEVHVVVSGRAHRFLTESFAQRPGFSIDEIHGLHLVYRDNQVLITKSLFSNLMKAPHGLIKNLVRYRALAERSFVPEVVISDFEWWAYVYAINHRIPVISLDNMQVINRCQNPKDFLKPSGHLWARTAVKIKLPGAYHYVITSFFFPPVRCRRTTLVPPILRPEILKAQRGAQEHVLVYQTQTTNETLIDALKALKPTEFRVYGLQREEDLGNVKLKRFSQTGFIEDLRTARAAISGGSFTLMGEAMHLGVPMHSIPVARQFEQILNAQYLQKLGYGSWSKSLDLERVREFLSNCDTYAMHLDHYPRQDNSVTFGVINELLDLVSVDEPAPECLRAKNMGAFEHKDWIDDALLDELEVIDSTLSEPGHSVDAS